MSTMTTLHTHYVPVATTYAGLRPGDRLHAGAIGLATVKHVRSFRDGSVIVLLGKPGWVRGRIAQGDPVKPVKALRADTYIRYVTDAGVQVLDLTDPATEFDADTEDILDGDGATVRTVVTGRYATVCTEHSTLVTHSSLARAKAHAADPEGWCESHRGDDE